MRKLISFLFFVGIFLMPTTGISQKIACSNDPYLPAESWKIDAHETSATTDFTSLKPKIKVVKLDKTTSWQNLRNRSLNACALDYLLEHKELIPKEWEVKDIRIAFAGTTYRDTGGLKLYRALSFCNGEWNWSRVYFEEDLLENYFVLIIDQ